MSNSIVPFNNDRYDLTRSEARPPSTVREIGDVAKTVALINVQGVIVTAWLNRRDDQTEITVTQDVTTGGILFSRNVIGRITVHTK